MGTGELGKHYGTYDGRKEKEEEAATTGEGGGFVDRETVPHLQ